MLARCLNYFVFWAGLFDLGFSCTCLVGIGYTHYLLWVFLLLSFCLLGFMFWVWLWLILGVFVLLFWVIECWFVCFWFAGCGVDSS